jgi:6-phosphogluconolactonase
MEGEDHERFRNIDQENCRGRDGIAYRQRAGAGGNIRLRLECRGRRHRRLSNARFGRTAARCASQSGEHGDADGGEPRSPLSVRGVAVEAVFGARLFDQPRHRRTDTIVDSSPLAESFPYISLDKSGRFLLGASYGGHLISVNAVSSDGRVAAEPLQVIPVGRNAHSIRVDESNAFVYVPTLGSDAIFQFAFDAKSGKLSSNTPAVYLMKAMTGPRHFVTSSDNKFVYVLSELLGTVTTFALDGKTGLLTEVSSASGLPPDTKLGPGASRGGPTPRNTDNDIWAADIHMTPSGKFLYISERTGNALGAFSVDGASGKLTYLSSAPTERQPRGFAIDPKGRFLVATGEKSETISVYAIDQATGALKLLNKYPTGKGANWVEIVSFE